VYKTAERKEFNGLQGRPCGFGQCLWPANCPVYFSNFWVGHKKIVQSQIGHFFVHSLEFFVQSFLNIGKSLISRLDKKSREWTKYELSGL
jgi:hypothetical protein